jgi:hypothetical protein
MRVARGYETTASVRHLVVLFALAILLLPAPGRAQEVTPLPSASLPAAPIPTASAAASATPAAAPTPAVRPTPTARPTLVQLHADRITFYYDRYTIEADGHVYVQTSNGMRLSGDAFSMDLKLNRFLIAGHVHLRSAGGNIDGAAIADFLDFDRIYFVPVISKPDRWTYENGDFKTPLKGREMPSDVFYFPDTGPHHPSLVAKSATIRTKSYVRFAGVSANLLSVGVPLPTYYLYFGTGRDLVQNSLSGANFDTTWNFAGNANSISSLHTRYDAFNRLYLGFEQHIAGNDPHEYAVFSVSPFTTSDKYWNLVTGEHIGSRFQIDTFSQVYTNDYGGDIGTTVAQTSYVTLTQAMNRSSLVAFFNLTNYNLTGKQNAYQDGELNHPSQGTLTWTSYNNQIFKTPLYLQTREGLGFNHDAYGLQNYGNVEYTTIWDPFLGFTLSLPNIKIGDREKAYSMYYLNASLDSEREWYNVPHRVNTQNSVLSLSRQFSHVFNAYLAYNVYNVSDLYLQGGYSPIPVEGTYNPLADFTGAETQRITTLGTTYSASTNLVTTVTVMHHDDFPGAYPNYYPVSPTNPIGQYTYNTYMGQPPWALTGEMRARLLPHVIVDLQRTYYFHYGSQIWSPSFVIQFSQQ